MKKKRRKKDKKVRQRQRSKGKTPMILKTKDQKKQKNGRNAFFNLSIIVRAVSKMMGTEWTKAPNFLEMFVRSCSKNF